MSGASSGEFSFDLYPGLDADLQAAFARNVQRGNASPEAVATAGIAAAVEDTLNQLEPETGSMSEAVTAWAAQELDAGFRGALHGWERYTGTGWLPAIPTSVDELMAQSPSLAETLPRLHEAAQALTDSGEVTPEGENIGDTMHLVVIPWQTMRDHLDDIEAFINDMRGHQGSDMQDDYIGPNIITAIKQNQTFYKAWDNPRIAYSAKGYLDYRIKKDGPWGVALMQTSNEAGVKSLVGKSPDELTNNQTHGLEIAGQEAGSMGIFEWWALTLQGDPKNLSSKDYTWMLANRVDLDGGSRVPYGFWGDGQVSSSLGGSGGRDTSARPRLAVI